jgi:two-component system, sensor histidine kinase RegB
VLRLGVVHRAPRLASQSESEIESQASLPLLVRLRWLALGGQIIALGCAQFWFGIVLPLPAIVGLVCAMAVSNLLLSSSVARNPRTSNARGVVGGMLVFDTVLLTLLLALSGGPMNPFTVLYLVHITLAAVVLGGSWTLWIAALSVGSFALLFVAPKGFADPHAHAALMAHHLQGMWAAFTLAAALTAYFVRRIAATIAAQRERIAALREGAARNARLASLTTLAAGAAHELGTPLGTIAVAAHELELGLTRPGDDEFREDVRLIAEEVERCHEILSHMGSRAGLEVALSRPIAETELKQRLFARFDTERARRIRISAASALSPIHAPVEELMHSLHALVKNGLDASRGNESVSLTLERGADGVRFVVEDAGCGMPASVLARAGEPFFTTKDPGRGLGLGLFLTRAFAESQGGDLSVESEPGRGTLAVLRLPLTEARTA